MPFFNEQLAYQYTEYDPELAKEYFRRAGLEYDSEGRLLGYDGEPIVITFMGWWEEIADMLEIFREHWAKVGVQVEIDLIARTLKEERRAANDFEAIWRSGGPGTRLIAVSNTHFVVNNTPGTFWGPRWVSWARENLYGLPALCEPEEPPPDVRRGAELYAGLASIADQSERNEVLAEIMQIAADGFYMFGGASRPTMYGTVHNRIGNGHAVEGAFMMGISSPQSGDHVSQWFIRYER